jgi:hypothetical protein
MIRNKEHLKRLHVAFVLGWAGVLIDRGALGAATGDERAELGFEFVWGAFSG